MEGVDVAITASGRRSMLKLAQRMTANFCAGVCASTVHKWNKLNSGNVDEDVRVMTRKSVDDPGEPPGIVLSAATSVWLPVSPQRLFDFLRDERLRSEWDILSNGGPMQEMAHIAKGQDHGNCVSLLRASVISLPPFPQQLFNNLHIRCKVSFFSHVWGPLGQIVCHENNFHCIIVSYITCHKKSYVRQHMFVFGH